MPATPTKRKANSDGTANVSPAKKKHITMVTMADPTPVPTTTDVEMPEISTVKSAMDTCEKFYALEDEIAASTTHQKLQEEYMKESSALKAAVKAYCDDPKENPLQVNVMHRIARMRRIARLCQYSTAQLRKETAAQLEKVDAKVLELQNVSSEVQHIQKEINRCLEFSAGDEDLELVPVPEFYADAPIGVSKPEITKNNEHEQYLARLEYEVIQRKQLQSTLQELEGRRNVLLSDIRGKEQRLQSLRPKIEALVKAAQPVQEILGVKKVESSSSEQTSLFASLPPMLAVIQIHACAYKDIMEDKNMQVKIVECSENAAACAKRKKEREENDVAIASSNGASTVETRVAAMASGIFDVHPMRVDVVIGIPELETNVTAQFRYLTELKLATLRWVVDDQFHETSSRKMSTRFLTGLFAGDNGEECPDPIGQLKLQQLKLSFGTIEEKLGRPYRFVQQLGGVDPANKDQKSKPSTHLAELMRKLVIATRQRVADYFALTSLLADFRVKKAGALTHYLGESAKITIHFNSFDSVEEEEFASAMPASLYGLITSKEYNDFERYRLELEDKNSSSKFTAWIAIPHDYPHRIPLFGVVFEREKTENESEGDQYVQQLEDIVNEMPAGDPKIFLKQMRSFCDQLYLNRLANFLKGHKKWDLSSLRSTSRLSPKRDNAMEGDHYGADFHCI
ncbi:unnamed protein product [Caenorhabditis auriculariae]|uniref:THO complex subunit 5 homolog n=1 Tax=Caenorhabditis auriculariae TaxID=2777116 RepID=A0A8S1H4M8_9PELO|nr:unnamed protein product [Caenorhabditis auriculariae]